MYSAVCNMTISIIHINTQNILNRGRTYIQYDKYNFTFVPIHKIFQTGVGTCIQYDNYSFEFVSIYKLSYIGVEK